MKLRGKILLMLCFSFCSLREVNAAERWREVIGLEGNWLFSIGDNKRWSETAFNDKNWEMIRVPSKWEDQGFNGYNGFAWYRKTFDGTLLRDPKINYTLFLGYIDDVDEVFINGHRIGSSGSFPPRFQTAYNAKRTYFIPKELINFAGKNTIAVRVYDSEIEGGIVKGEIGIYTDEDDKQMEFNLRGVWDFVPLYRRNTFGMPLQQSENRTPPSDAKWTSITVPGFWEHQGYNNYDGSAWYRKQFIIPKSLEGEDLILILGKIDDYDETYLNGKLLASTRMHDKLRIYNIPHGAFRTGSLNLLLIYVEDTGGMGGMYEGPIGIIRESDLTRFMRWRNR
jgi:hypothetical protein